MSKQDYTQDSQVLLALIKDLQQWNGSDDDYARIVKKHTTDSGKIFSKSQIIASFRKFQKQGLLEKDDSFITKIQKKPIRTSSGVTPVTVLTKPFPCPGKCIFCPSDVRMPKSYLSDEPGAQRAERNWFDPYLQTFNRLKAYHDIGHNVEKVEIIVLGGTWSYYPESYQIWFIKEVFRALNDFFSADDREKIEKKYRSLQQKIHESKYYSSSSKPQQNDSNSQDWQQKIDNYDKSYNQIISQMYVAPERKLGFDKLQQATWEQLQQQQKINETAKCRCVGLVIETRPDNISPQEVVRIRRLGCTKTQIGIQSLQDEVLQKNKRGHDVAATAKAFRLLRQAGFKIHAHWMANLYGSSVELDKMDFQKLFSDPRFRPDELKIYPCSLIASAELMQYYKSGQWSPYTQKELMNVVSFAILNTPPYCRLTRVIRDIPSTDIVVGNKKTNFRQLVKDRLDKANQQSQDIRAREIRDTQLKLQKIEFSQLSFQADGSQEFFLQFVTDINFQEKILAFLRLSMPNEEAFIPELSGAAIIREIHVYGPAVGLGKRMKDKTQHQGLGTQLIEKAKQIALENNYQKLAVISAVGTREYYRKKGFSDDGLYQSMDLS